MSNDPLWTLKTMVRAAHGSSVTDEGAIHAMVDQLRPVIASEATDEEIARLKRELSSELYITVERGVSITSKDLEPWLAAKKAKIEWPRWEAYRQYLLNEGRPPKVMARLDEDTDAILDLMGDPTDPGPWQRRGLVIGDVQSGKTSTYLGLLNKAVDAGFRVIILLGGHTESLRQQTQQRVDAGFLGYDTEIAAASNVLANRRPLGVGLLNKKVPSPHSLTTTAQDYGKKNNQGTVIQLETSPAVFVIKKNVHVFDAVNALLGQQHAEGGRISEPVLILDDECDYASVNTADPAQDPTRINGKIQTMLAHSERGMYVAFTATPFANIFIDPDQPQDLFPQDFIYALESPSSYFGAARTFTPGPAENDPTITIDDAATFFPPRHKSTFIVTGLPPSLKDAVRAFMLVNALRDLRGTDTPPQRSMLVNVSTFKKIQRQVGDLVGEFLEDQRNAVTLHSADPVTRDTTPEIAELARVYAAHFSDAGVPWDEVLDRLVSAIADIQVRVFNSDTEKQVDDKGEPASMPQRLIAVGGNVLSRGLTLEGLTISYFHRQVRAADTLLQMARWFGYRPGYDDLCRVWITESSADDFRYVADAVDELKTELRRMRELQLTPRDFGLRVRKHPGALLVTAKNKSRTAEERTAVVSLLGRNIETSKLSPKAATIETNLAALERLINQLRSFGQADMGSPLLRWEDCPRSIVADFLTTFTAHPAEELWFGNGLRDYVRGGSWTRLDRWDVVIVQGKGEPVPVGDLRIKPGVRTIREMSPGKLMVSGKSARLAGTTDIRNLVDPAEARRITDDFNARREALEGKEPTDSVPETLFYAALRNPVLLVYPMICKPDPEQEARPYAKSLLVGAKIALPGVSDLTGRRGEGDVKYLINKVAQDAWQVADFSVDEGDEIDG